MYSYHFVIQTSSWNIDGVAKVHLKVTDYQTYRELKDLLFKEFKEVFLEKNITSSSKIQITSLSLINEE